MNIHFIKSVSCYLGALIFTFSVFVLAPAFLCRAFDIDINYYLTPFVLLLSVIFANIIHRKFKPSSSKAQQ
jgi:accessory gene regulator protein AgrB